MKKTWTKVLTVGGAAAALVIGVAGPAAAAEGNGSAVNAANKLRSFNQGTAVSSFNTIDDSPADSNHRALVINVDQTGDAAFVYTNKSSPNNAPGLNVSPGALKNVSFDYDTTHNPGSGLRINVLLGDHSVLFLDPNTCSSSPYAVTSNWARADFTGNLTNCTVRWNTDGSTYSANGTENALQVFANAHPTLKVWQVYVISDGAGTYVIDRLALGTNYLYNTSKTRAVNCGNDEAKC
jgi:hypothetical protein